MTAPLLCVGECMVELSSAGDGLYRLGYGGDTLNTCVTLARLAGPGRAGYVTRLGDDLYGARMREAWIAEGVDVDAVEVAAGETTGLYAIETDASGERSFTYWRSQAAARGLFTTGGAVERMEAIRAAELVYFSGITLAILPNAGRERLLDAAETARSRGARVAVDPNFRPRLWSAGEAAPWIARAYRIADVILTSAEEEATLFPAVAEGDPAAWAPAHLSKLGGGEMVLKRGERGATLVTGDRLAEIAPVAPERVVDTTGAGDAFNAGYLWARQDGRDAKTAARTGCALGAVAVAHPGAVPPAEAVRDALR